MTFKYEKSSRDIAQESFDLKSNQTMIFLKNRESLSFVPGDILIKRYKDGSLEQLSCGASRKYQYLFENELGIGYYRLLKANGALGENLYCMAECNPDYFTFELDPDYADHILLSGETQFDALAQHREKKAAYEEIKTYNKKHAKHASSTYAWNAMRQSLKNGQEFWLARYPNDLSKCKYEVLDVIRVQHTKDEIHAKYDLPRAQWMIGTGNAFSYEYKVRVLKHSWKDVGTVTTVRDRDLTHSWLSFVQPRGSSDETL